MNRKARKYPSYRTLVKNNKARTLLDTRFCVLYFIPDDVKSFKLTKKNAWGELDMFVSYPNTRDGYNEAVSACEAWIDKQLDEIECEFYCNK